VSSALADELAARIQNCSKSAGTLLSLALLTLLPLQIIVGQGKEKNVLAFFFFFCCL
jgi:hypothetical protein